MKNTDGKVCCDETWEEAYARFETPEQEIQKFIKRLREAGASEWKRDAAIVEIFCGRGNGLHALASLGFTQLEGADLSASLLSLYKGPATCHVADCRALPFPDETKDIILVQGGLHHLPSFPDDLEQTLNEVRRVLKPNGKFVVIEPWPTAFLHTVHWFCNQGWARRISSRLDALATMIEHERSTYEQWLGNSNAVIVSLRERFETDLLRVGWGKIMFVGHPEVTKVASQ